MTKPKREPFWGPNFWPFVIQSAAAVVIYLIVSPFFADDGWLAMQMCEHIHLCSNEAQIALQREPVLQPMLDDLWSRLGL